LQLGSTMPSESRPSHVAAPTRPPAIGLNGFELRRAYLAAMTPSRSRVVPPARGAATNNDPKSLEALLLRASELLAGVPAQDSRSRLLQTALLRRDHALLAAVVQSFGTIAREPALVPFRSATERRAYRRPLQIRTSERPTCRPPRRVAAE
jgi:hypothetical protein